MTDNTKLRGESRAPVQATWHVLQIGNVKSMPLEKPGRLIEIE